MHYTSLENWKQRRNDKRVENYWLSLESRRKLTTYEEYQKEWNYIEREYNANPSNNKLDLANPSFAFTTNLAKYLVYKTVDNQRIPPKT